MTGAEQIAAERKRQVEAEGWTPDHDKAHASGELMAAALAYIEHARGHSTAWVLGFAWPWEPQWFKPAEPLRELVKAGALIAAEIDRLSDLKAGSK